MVVLVPDLKPTGLCIWTCALNKELADQLLEKARDWAGKKS
jgi:hypothetical protein